MASQHTIEKDFWLTGVTAPTISDPLDGRITGDGHYCMQVSWVPVTTDAKVDVRVLLEGRVNTFWEGLLGYDYPGGRASELITTSTGAIAHDFRLNVVECFNAVVEVSAHIGIRSFVDSIGVYRYTLTNTPMQIVPTSYALNRQVIVSNRGTKACEVGPPTLVKGAGFWVEPPLGTKRTDLTLIIEPEQTLWAVRAEDQDVPIHVIVT